MANKEDIYAKLAEFDKLKKQGIRFLLKERRVLDRQLAKLGHLVGAGGKKRKVGRRVCSICGKTGHNARTCPMKGKKT